jgi:hypothetical protein
MIRDQEHTSTYKKRLGKSEGIGGPVDKRVHPTTNPNRGNGFYYYGAEKNENNFVYRIAKLFLLLPVIVLLLIGNGYFLEGVITIFMGVAILIAYALILFRS